MNFNEHIIEELPQRFGGSDRKRTVLMDDGCVYLLKFPDAARQKKIEMSYINNAISEYIGTKIFELSGFETQEVHIGTFTTEKGVVKVACACKNMCEPGEDLYEMQTLSLRDVDSENNKVTFDSIKEMCDNNKYIDSTELMNRYYDMFVVDALIGNTDRHNGNWGIIMSATTKRISPIYDCGSSLSPLLDDSQLSEKTAKSMAVNTFSAIRDNDGKRINYKDYILSRENEEVNKAIARIVPKIDMGAIKKMISDIPYISDTRKDFYKEMLDIRYNQVLIPALEKEINIKNQDLTL